MKKHFKTGFPSLDEFIKISKKQGALLAIAARPSMGKTSLSLNIAQNVAFKSNLSVGIFSLELTREQLVQRMLCSETEIDTQKFKRGSLQTKDWKKLAVAMDNFSEADIYIDDTAARRSGTCLTLKFLSSNA